MIYAITVVGKGGFNPKYQAIQGKFKSTLSDLME